MKLRVARKVWRRTERYRFSTLLAAAKRLGQYADILTREQIEILELLNIYESDPSDRYVPCDIWKGMP